MSSPESSDSSSSLNEKRASDADRKLVADRLKVALEEGRLDLTEYDERLQGTYLSKTYADLDSLLADIPGTSPLEKSQLEPSAPKEAADRGSGRTGKRGMDKSLKQAWAGLGGSAIFFTGIWAMTWLPQGESPSYYWPIWVFGFWFIGIAAATVSSFMKD